MFRPRLDTFLALAACVPRMSTSDVSNTKGATPIWKRTYNMLIGGRVTASQCFGATFLMLIASSTFATERFHASTLEFVYPLANGDFVIGFDSDPSTCSSASAPKYLYVSVGQNGVTAAGSAKLFAAAMTALVTRQTVAAAFDDATSNCYVNRFSVQD